MRFHTASLVFAVALLCVAVPAADALSASSFTASVMTKYDLRAATKAKKAAAAKKKQSIELPAIAKGGLLFGDPDATTTVVLFTDIECPFCKRFYKGTYPSLKKDYIDTGNVRFVIRHFPLSFHAHAFAAAEAVVCARAQGDDKARSLYTALIGSKELTSNSIAVSVNVSGLDEEILQACVDGADAKTVIDNDTTAATDAGVMGTPAFFIRGPTGIEKTITGAYPFETFERALKDVQKK